MVRSPLLRFVRLLACLTPLAGFVMTAAACGSSTPATGATPTPSQASATVASSTPATTATSASTSAPSATAAPAPGTPPRRGGSLRIAQGADPTSCDLHTARASGYVSVHVCNPMLSQIVRVAAGDHNLIQPDLATSWSSSPDGLDWTFKLRSDATWHDGTPVTSGDIKFSLDRIVAPPPSVQIGRAGAIARYVSDTAAVVAPDAQTVTVRTGYAAAAFLPMLASVYVSAYPKAAVEKLDPPSMVAFSSVVGSGPFKAADSVRGTSYRMSRFEGYYEPGLPYLDEVVFFIMPEPAVRMAALRSHAIDTIAIVTDPEAESIEKDLAGKISVHASPSAGGSTVQMNLQKAPFTDPLVRMAVNLAISRKDAELALGPGMPGAIMPPGSPWELAEAQILGLPGNGPLHELSGEPARGYGDPEVQRAEARKLLSDAGLTNGFETRLHVRADPFGQTLAEFAAAQLRLVGIRVQVVPVEPGAYQDMVLKREFDMIAHSHSFALDDPDAILFDNYACGGLENYPGLCDPDIDGLIAEQSRAVDLVTRKAIVSVVQRQIWESNAKVWFQWTIRRTPVWTDVHGMSPGGPSLYQGRRLERVWLAP